MYADFHTHTEFSGDCQVPVRVQIERAAALGMKEFCITDHHDYDAGEGGDLFLLDLDSYFPTLRKLKEEYSGRIRVNIGIELGLQAHIKEYLENLEPKLPVDLIIGSCHFIDGKDPYYPSFFEGRTEKDAYVRYFEVSLNRIRCLSCYDVFGHLDYVVRYGPNQNKYYHFSDYQEYIDPILKTLIEKGKGLECNTSGLKYGLGHPNPSEDILRRYRELGGEILTIGSDAHAPQHIGYDFDRIGPLLKACGFRYYTVFHDRKPEFVPL